MKRMFAKLLGGLALVTIVLAGCAPSAHIEKDDQADFRQYKTYSWVSHDPSESKKNNLVERNVQNGVNKELAKLGWREVRNNPDLLLSYDVLVEKKTKQQNDAVYSEPFGRTFYNPYYRRFFRVYYPSQFMGYNNYGVTVREGTLTITMTDTRTDKTVWQGWATKEVNNQNLTSKDVQTTVRSIFRKFDVAKQ